MRVGLYIAGCFFAGGKLMDGSSNAPRSILLVKQVGGDHYKIKAIQPWTAMEAWMSAEAFAGFLQGNVIKYLARYKDKGGVQDLEKARHYLDKLIEIERQPVHASENSAPTGTQGRTD